MSRTMSPNAPAGGERVSWALGALLVVLALVSASVLVIFTWPPTISPPTPPSMRVPVASVVEGRPLLVQSSPGLGFVATGEGRGLDSPTPGSAYLVRVGFAVTAISGESTHEGCTVVVTEGHFKDPCHGATFGFDGTVLTQPAIGPLRPLVSRVRGGYVELDLTALPR